MKNNLEDNLKFIEHRTCNTHRKFECYPCLESEAGLLNHKLDMAGRNIKRLRSRIVALEDSLQAAIVEIRAWHKQAGTRPDHSSLHNRLCITLGPAPEPGNDGGKK